MTIRYPVKKLKPDRRTGHKGDDGIVHQIDGGITHTIDSYSKTCSLGIKTDDPTKLVRLVKEGFDFKRVEEFHRFSGLAVKTIANAADIRLRTLTRRQTQRRLRPDESDRLLRVARIFDLTVDLFESDRDAARTWLEQPQPGLGGAVPLEFASTDVGAAKWRPSSPGWNTGSLHEAKRLADRQGQECRHCVFGGRGPARGGTLERPRHTGGLHGRQRLAGHAGDAGSPRPRPTSQ